jgi:hypothetical protein
MPGRPASWIASLSPASRCSHGVFGPRLPRLGRSEIPLSGRPALPQFRRQSRSSIAEPRFSAPQVVAVRAVKAVYSYGVLAARFPSSRFRRSFPRRLLSLRSAKESHGPAQTFTFPGENSAKYCGCGCTNQKKHQTYPKSGTDDYCRRTYQHHAANQGGRDRPNGVFPRVVSDHVIGRVDNFRRDLRAVGG